MILTYFLLITSQLTINCNCLTSSTLEPPKDEPFRVRAGSFTVISADYQGIEDEYGEFAIKAGRLWGSKQNKQCAGIEMTSGRSLVKVDSRNDEHGTYTVSNRCAWKSKITHYGEEFAYAGSRDSNSQCLGVRAFDMTPQYLVWSSEPQCQYFYITAAYEHEKDMFNIFYKHEKYFYSPSCCLNFT